jgi:hypothetical protein
MSDFLKAFTSETDTHIILQLSRCFKGSLCTVLEVRIYSKYCCNGVKIFDTVIKNDTPSSSVPMKVCILFKKCKWIHLS